MNPLDKVKDLYARAVATLFYPPVLTNLTLS